MKLRFAHTSDTHSTFPVIEATDLIIHSGDLFPNKTRGNWNIEPEYQKDWLIRNLDSFVEWIGERTFFFCAGNHDFIEPDVFIDILKAKGIDAYNLTNRYLEFNGIKFAGFPYIPFLAGEWNYELRIPEMEREINRLKLLIENNGLDILICHCPPYGILDKAPIKSYNSLGNIVSYFEHCGNQFLSRMMYYWFPEVNPQNIPKLICCGHIHSAHGFQKIEETLISNAATTINYLEWKDGKIYV